MSLFNKLKDQINPFDGGRTFNSPQPGQQAGRVIGDVMKFGGTPPSPNGTMMGKQIQRMEQLPRMEYAQPRQLGAEDDGLVDTPQGRMPLHQVSRGQQWQNPDNGYSPNGYSQYQEDDGPVLSGGRIVPLSSLNQGEPWTNPQNGYSPQQENPLARLRKLLGY